MGIHSGPVSEVADVNERANISRSGNQPGAAGDGLWRRRAHSPLQGMWRMTWSNIRQWRSHLHDLGECEVKHDVRVHVVNLYTDELGNPEVPGKFQQTKVTQPAPAAALSEAKPARRSWSWIAALIMVAALAAAAGFYISSRRAGPKAPPSATAPAPTAIPEKSIAVLPFENLSERQSRTRTSLTACRTKS